MQIQSSGAESLYLLQDHLSCLGPCLKHPGRPGRAPERQRLDPSRLAPGPCRDPCSGTVHIPGCNQNHTACVQHTAAFPQEVLASIIAKLMSLALTLNSTALTFRQCMQEHDSHLDGDVGATALAPEGALSIFVPGAAPSVPLKPVLFHGALLLSAC